MNMKRKVVLLSISIMMVSLTGCSSINDYLAQRMLEKSGITEEEQYKTYQSYAESGVLDQDGYYKDEQEDIGHDGEIHVTFSKNENLGIEYYRDSAKSIVVDVDDCYINPGDSLYASLTVSEDVFSSTYTFAGFEIYECNEDGTYKLAEDIAGDYETTGRVLTVPSDCKFTELSVAPTGEYEERKISLYDYYTDDDEKENPLDGTWLINDKEYTSDSISINPISPYIISYEYDSDEYFYRSSLPEAYYNDNEQGIVIFNQRQASDETVDYSVELHKYLSISLVSDKDRTVTVNGGDKQTVKANEELIIPRLKYGDIVIIDTDKEWADLNTNRNLILTSTQMFEAGGYKYQFVVPEKDGEFEFNPDDYHYEHGTIVFKCFGSVVNETQYLAQGSKIYYEQESADPGYWLTSGDHFIIVSDEETTQKQLNEIHFTPMVQVTVNLNQPEAGGEIIYRANGNQIKDSAFKTYSGTVITMDFNPWEGWISAYTDGRTFTVGEDKSQTIKVDGTDVNQVFKEDDGHKPTLTVTLEKSVGETMEFTFSASGLSSEDYKYESGWFRSDYKVITGKKIGTEKSIQLAMKNRAIQSGQAVRIVITKTDNNGNKTVDPRYYDDLTKDIPAIDIYSASEIATSTTWYKSIDISIGIVDIEKHKMPSPSAHTTITVRNSETNLVLKDDDLIEPGKKVSVTISPSAGYYVTGKKVSNDVYQETMKYSDYLKNIDSIIESHPAMKIYTITLDTSDAWAQYTYKLDKKDVSGTIQVRDGQKLSLTYEITDPAYKLSEAAGGFLGIGASTSKATKEISISSDLDGTTVTKTTFGISTVKGE